jgi:hypothetical protein
MYRADALFGEDHPRRSVALLATGRPASRLTYITPGVFSSARLASPLPHMADCPSCSVEC